MKFILLTIFALAVATSCALARDLTQSERAELVEKGKFLREQHKPKVADAELDKVINSLPPAGEKRAEWALAFLLRAECKENLGDYKSAAEDIQTYFALNPAARWSSAPGCRILAEAGQYKDAIHHIQRHIFSVVNHGPPYALLALCAGVSGNHELAADGLLNAVRYHFSGRDMQVERGPFCSDETVKVLRNKCNVLSRQKPRDPNAYLVLAFTDMFYQDYYAAITKLDKAVKLAPSDSQLLVARGVCYMVNAKFDKARADLIKALQLNSRQATTYYALLRYYVDIGKFDDYFNYLEDRFSKDPKNALIPIAKAHGYEKMNDRRAADHEYSRAVAIDPHCAAAFNGRGLLEEQMFKYKEAVADFTAAIKLEPADPHPYRDRATCYYSMHNDKDAIPDLTKVIELTQDPYAYAARGECYRRIGKPDLAARDQRMARQNEPRY